MSIIDPEAAQQQLDNTEGLSPNQRLAAQAEINAVRAEYQEQGLKFVEKQEQYVAETTARITNTYAACRSGYEEFAQWLRDTEPTAKDARKRLDKLHREEPST